MCDFHLKGQCFHPQKAKKGLVAVNCTFNDCSHCTNKTWQKGRIHEDYTYYESIVKLANVPEEHLAETEKKPLVTRIFSSSK